MRQIDMATWPRKAHFELFKDWDYPHINYCANVDVGAFYQAVKQANVSFFVATVYVIARVANAVPEFRQRIRDDQVVEHDVVHPTTTVLTRDNLVGFCTIEYAESAVVFAMRAAERIAKVQEEIELSDDPGRDDLLFLTAIPWVSFTSIMHPIRLEPADSIPRFAWGKFFDDGKSLIMPLSVQAHHSLVDGLHMGQFYEGVQSFMQEPESALAST